MSNGYTPPQTMTVAQLREALNKIEERWSEADVQYLGDFEDQQIWMWPVIAASDNGGYRPAAFEYNMYGFMIVDPPKPTEEQ